MINIVFGGQIYVIVFQGGRSWQPFGDRRKSPYNYIRYVISIDNVVKETDEGSELVDVMEKVDKEAAMVANQVTKELWESCCMSEKAIIK